ncbi:MULTISPECIES: adenine deaminase [unclassified Oceanispirochaeta]|uniref:adenine deaminase n=1 Tax=unclassified Oceanispirochaeta TaxID=2635722 RepID=UPI000E08DEE1|nr:MULTISPECIES: adenine deaminase [unclassified Oceanispirochaeta]MBF9016889.1 adenine deaminase [Oceanispirochaeta sp. M2]NPD73252.1 adenine deaminase [Oceanispirochaeta sp. M1]RDG31118.1 adenine deaminase [Oceanispirochaeta sp. M1]
MQKRLEELKQELRAASGNEPADLYIDNIKILNVYTEEITEGSLVIKNGRVVAVSPGWDVEAKIRYDGRGMTAVPGFMDSHIHIETTLLTPEALASVIVPWGTTSLFVDAMEIANVAGIDGLNDLLKGSANLPFRLFMEVPSRVPTAPGLETTGGILGVEEVSQLLKESNAVSLGELDPPKVLNLMDDYLNKILSAREEGRICNGHAIGLDWDSLNVYAAAGLSDDHESVEFQELKDRLSLGIRALIREGSSERNLDTLIAGVLKHNLPTEDLLFCTDDKHVNDIVREGHISYNVQRSIELGMDPVKAIKIATINTARHFRLDHELGSLAPGRFADILLLKDLNNMKPEAVFKGGVLVAEKGRILKEYKKEYPDYLNHTVKLKKELRSDDFKIKAEGSKALVRVICMIENQIINTESSEWLTVDDNSVEADVSKDILRLSVVERYGKNGQLGNGFVRGFQLKEGAMASSVSHDHHNIVVVGSNTEDMMIAVKEVVRTQGGFALANKGQVIDSIALPLGGLMSPDSAEQVMVEMNRLNQAVRDMGCPMSAPFMSLSFISLPTVPALGLTDMGLIDVLKHKIVPVVLEEK